MCHCCFVLVPELHGHTSIQYRVRVLENSGLRHESRITRLSFRYFGHFWLLGGLTHRLF